MDLTNTKPLTGSDTFRWAAGAIVAYLIRRFALPELPAEVNGEVVNVIIMAVDVSIPVMMAMAIRGRAKARQIIGRVF